MIAAPPTPDPPPAAVRAHQGASVDWAYSFEAPFGPWTVRCYVPVSSPKVCQVVR